MLPHRKQSNGILSCGLDEQYTLPSLEIFPLNFCQMKQFNNCFIWLLELNHFVKYAIVVVSQGLICIGNFRFFNKTYKNESFSCELLFGLMMF